VSRARDERVRLRANEKVTRNTRECGGEQVFRDARASRAVELSAHIVVHTGDVRPDRGRIRLAGVPSADARRSHSTPHEMPQSARAEVFPRNAPKTSL